MSRKARLSKSILEMKFMKRTKEKLAKETEEAEGRELYVNEITSKMMNSDSNFAIESSLAVCESLKEGRLSFRGMNPEIERLLELDQARNYAIKRQPQPKEVSDSEMVNFYSAASKGKIKRKLPTTKKQIQFNNIKKMKLKMEDNV